MDSKTKKACSYSHRGSHSKTIIFDVLSSDGKQLFRQYMIDLTAILLLNIL